MSRPCMATDYGPPCSRTTDVEPFRRSGRGRITARISVDERDYLLFLLAELEPIVAPHPEPPGQDPLAAMVGISTADRPEDPGALRLFPDAYEDPDAAAEFRRFTEQGLRSAKAATLDVVRETLVAAGEKVVLSREQAESWVATVNDLRLLLGTRAGVTADPDQFADLTIEDPRAPVVETYEFLGWVQATLLHALYGIDA
jgi:hypothetical protein